MVDGEGRALPPGDVGEIQIKAPNVMKGYWNKDEATKKAVVDDWFFTGDAGYFDTDGYLYIHDRVKDMIVSGGENIIRPKWKTRSSDTRPWPTWP